jgi:hypothetical protein
MMYRKLRKYFYSLATLVILMVPQESIAKISPKAFKGITKYFNDGQEYFLPFWEKPPLKAGLSIICAFMGILTLNMRKTIPDSISLIAPGTRFRPCQNTLSFSCWSVIHRNNGKR